MSLESAGLLTEVNKALCEQADPLSRTCHDKAKFEAELLVKV